MGRAMRSSGWAGGCWSAGRRSGCPWLWPGVALRPVSGLRPLVSLSRSVGVAARGRPPSLAHLPRGGAGTAPGWRAPSPRARSYAARLVRDAPTRPARCPVGTRKGVAVRLWIASILISAFLAEGWRPAMPTKPCSCGTVATGRWISAAGPSRMARGRAVFPSGARLEPGGWAWVARERAAFAGTFGEAPRWCFAPGCAMRTAGGGPRLADGGDGLRLRDRAGGIVDVVTWEAG